MAEKDARMAESDETIAELCKLVDELQSLKVNLEEITYEEEKTSHGKDSHVRRLSAGTGRRKRSAGIIISSLERNIELFNRAIWEHWAKVCIGIWM